ncbi:hypothetical protein [Streptomyces apocyni]|uniref:hypothetical protein n=1 Tax=Streptomyces apocyni TaxID=2654677 RepID=UPI0012EAFFB4|nr:hypothetical protein [Streptomyces apocyni]
MAGRATAAQRRIISAAEAVTGRIVGSEAQLEGLVRRGLAFRHPRPPRAYFLTPAGHRLRDELLAATPPPPAPVTDAATGVFTARTGGEGDPVAGPGRQREVHSAWQGLLELRRMTRPDGDTGRPCGWERTHLVQAAALALEAAGCMPAGAEDTGGGYRVAESPQPEAVAVRLIPGGGGMDDDGLGGLGGCAAALEAAGWQVSEHQERGGGRCLLASPRRD